MIDLGLRAVDLDDQQRLDIERIAGMDEFLDRVDRWLVHHLHAGGNDAPGNDAAHALPGILGGCKADQHGASALRPLQDADRDLGDDAEQTFRSGHDAEEIIAAGIEMLAAEAHDLAVDQHQLAAEQVVGGHAVFQAVHTA